MVQLACLTVGGMRAQAKLPGHRAGMLSAEGRLPQLVAARLVRVFMPHAALYDRKGDAGPLGGRPEDVAQIMKAKLSQIRFFSCAVKPVPKAIFGYGLAFAEKESL